MTIIRVSVVMLRVENTLPFKSHFLVPNTTWNASLMTQNKLEHSTFLAATIEYAILLFRMCSKLY